MLDRIHWALEKGLSMTSRLHFFHANSKRFSLLFFVLVLASTLGLTGCAQDETNNEVSQEQTSENVENALDISVQIKSDVANAELDSHYNVVVAEDATALDALKATGVAVTTEQSSYGEYVTGIDGLETGAHGDMSGWIYKVNDDSPTVGADNFELTTGDVVLWEYVTSYE